MPNYKYVCDCCGYAEVQARPVDDMKKPSPCYHCTMDGLLQYQFDCSGVTIAVPDAFHQNQADILPTQEHEIESWRKYSYKK